MSPTDISIELKDLALLLVWSFFAGVTWTMFRKALTRVFD